MVNDCTRETQDKVQVDFLPFPTDLCDLCADGPIAGRTGLCQTLHGSLHELRRLARPGQDHGGDSWECALHAQVGVD